jgi:predicted Zn-dependent peptidase
MKTNFFKKLLRAALALSALAFSLQTMRAQQDAAIARRPEQLKFPALNYEPPAATDYRVQLKSGPVAYVVPDRELPLVNISIFVRVGSYLEPAGKEGLAELTGYLLTHGGTKALTAEALDERLAFLAAELDSGVGDSQGTVSLNLLSKDMDEGFSILRDVLTAPRFQEDKLALRKQQMLQEMEQRNDQSEDIEEREHGFLSKGEGFYSNHYSTKSSVEGITTADLEEFHKKWFHPDDFVVAVSGDFDKGEMTARLEKLFGDWPFTGEKPGPIPDNPKLAPAGIYIVDKDVNQGRVSIMLPGIRRENPDYLAVQVMNDILGGGGFTSHIMSSVRSDEGLAYSAYSVFQGGIYYPSTFTAAYQSKSRTVAYAASIVLKEISKMTQTPPTVQELALSKRGYIDRFPHLFATKAQVAVSLATEEFTGRYAKDPEYFHNYRRRIAAVTADDVLRVAKKYLAPERAVILIVGQKNEIMLGHPDHPVKLGDLSSGGIKDIPLRDPFTMKPMESAAKDAK